MDSLSGPSTRSVPQCFFHRAANFTPYFPHLRPRMGNPGRLFSGQALTSLSPFHLQPPYAPLFLPGSSRRSPALSRFFAEVRFIGVDTVAGLPFCYIRGRAVFCPFCAVRAAFVPPSAVFFAALFKDVSSLLGTRCHSLEVTPSFRGCSESLHFSNYVAYLASLPFSLHLSTMKYTGSFPHLSLPVGFHCPPCCRRLHFVTKNPGGKEGSPSAPPGPPSFYLSSLRLLRPSAPSCAISRYILPVSVLLVMFCALALSSNCDCFSLPSPHASIFSGPGRG